MTVEGGGMTVERGGVTGLNVADINLKDQLIHIRKGKGQKDRMVPVNETGRRQRMR